MTRILLLAAFLFPFPVLHVNGADMNPKLYASFDGGAQPEITAPGAGLLKAEKLKSVDGKFGKAFYFSRKQDSGDLLYNLGGILKGDWTVACWVKLDQPGNYKFEGKVPDRSLFRTGFAWKQGNIFAHFDNWGRFHLNHFDRGGKSCGAAVNASVFPAGEWIHTAFTFENGKHHIYLNGIEATYATERDIKEAGPVQKVLRIGSLDTHDNQIEGAVDELKVFDRALSAEEVKEIMSTVPGKETVRTLLYDSFAGEVAPRGTASFSAAELVFGEHGVRIIRYGYDRKGQLTFKGVPGPGREGFSVGFRLTPDWNGADDTQKRGLLWMRAGLFGFDFVKEGGNIVFALQSGSRRESVALSAVSLFKGRTAEITAGFDPEKKELFLSVAGKEVRKALNFAPECSTASGSIGVGDLFGSDVYSDGQLEGAIADLLLADAPLAQAEFDGLQTAARKKREEELAAASVPLLPKQSKETALWSWNGAEKIATSTRERKTLNALWRFQLTDPDRPFSLKNWEYLAVPGRYSGQENGFTDCEFFRRDANLKVIPGTVDYYGKSPFRYVNSYFERTFLADPCWENREIVLLIDELSRTQQGTVYLNGRELVKLPEGGHYFEIRIPPEQLRFGKDNFLTIHVIDNGRYWAWRGIKGDVALLLKPFCSANAPGIATSVASKTIAFDLTLNNDSAESRMVIPEAQIAGKNAPAVFAGKPVMLAPGETKKISFGGDWADPELWSPDNPYLYTVQFRLVNQAGKPVDELEPVRFGFREFEIRGRDYYLNGHPIHLFTHDGWANSTSDPEEARRVARTLKKLGFNSVRTLFPAEAKDSDPDTVMRTCDEEGLIQFVGIDGVTGREFASWNDPAVHRNLEREMAARIRHFRNHPSNVMYFLSSNFLGYGWDFHPLKMADGYLPDFKKRQFDICMEGVKIMQKYDSSRPFFFQAGGNFGPVITTNAYFCWWPRAERTAWPEEWSKIGKKPLDIIETGFPYYRSFNGMDIKYGRESRPLFFYENLARYYGPEVYLDNDRDTLELTAQSTTGKFRTPYSDAPYLQKLKSDLLRETIPLWRGFGISGISPFEELNFAFAQNAPYHSSHVAKSWAVKADEFRRFGWVPDRRKYQYHSDIDSARPLPVAQAFIEVFAPRAAFFDGGADSPADRRRNYSGGETLVKGVTLINDTQSKADFRIGWQLNDPAGKVVGSGRIDRSLAPGRIVREPIAVKLPDVAKRTEFHLVSSQIAQPLEITVFPAPVPAGSAGIALYDEKGMTAKLLGWIAPGVRDAKTLTDLDGISLLVVGRESLTTEFAAFARKHRLAERVDAGKLNVLICEQRPEALAKLGMRAKAIYARDCFPTPALEISGLRAADYSDWAGDGTLASSHQLPASDTEGNVASPLWHWTNRNMVAAYPLRRPVEGEFEVLLVCGKDLIYTPLLEMRSGAGSIVFSQMELSARSIDDPAAGILLAGLLNRCSKLNPPRKAVEFLTPQHLDAGELDTVLRKVEAGANLLAPPESFRLFGLRGTPETVSRFSLAPAGQALWPDFTARDGFLRAPQNLTVLTGENLTALTVPAFAAVRKLGKGKIFFLEFPADPQAEELARGLAEGKDSSVVWSAEILAERFLLLKNRLAAKSVGVIPSLAKYLENPKEERSLDLDGVWKIQVGDAGEEPVNVPGYYNQQLTRYNGFIGIAVYRKTVQLPQAWRDRELLLEIESIDDLDETLVNGVKVGSTGKDTPGYWSAQRLYRIPAELTRSGELEIAVRVDNLQGNAGITGHVRLSIASEGAVDPADRFPYGGLSGAYDTETHIRW